MSTLNDFSESHNDKGLSHFLQLNTYVISSKKNFSIGLETTGRIEIGRQTDFSALSNSLKIGLMTAFVHNSGEWLVSRRALKMNARDLSIKGTASFPTFLDVSVLTI